MRPHDDSSEWKNIVNNDSNIKNREIQKKTLRLKSWRNLYILTGVIENPPICSDSRSKTLNFQGKFGAKYRFFLSFKIELCGKDTFNALWKYNKFRGIDKLKIHSSIWILKQKYGFSAALTPRSSGLLAA